MLPNLSEIKPKVNLYISADTPMIVGRFAELIYRRISAAHTSRNGDSLENHFDSHADTCICGSNYVPLDPPIRFVSVTPFTNEYKALQEMPIQTVGTVWNDSKGKEYLLVIHEAIYFGDRMDSSLLNPNQLRSNGITVHDCPRQFDKSSTHSIMDPHTGVTIPLAMDGIHSGFHSHLPTNDDILYLPRIVLTANAEWNPSSPTFAAIEEKYVMSCRKSERRSSFSNRARTVSAVHTCRLAFSTFNTPEFCDDYEGGDSLYSRLIASVRVASDDVYGDGLSGGEDVDIYPAKNILTRHVGKVSTTERRAILTPEILSKRWGIGLVKAQNTLSVTTQSGLRNVLAPSERKMRLKAPWLKFPSIDCKFYTDQFFSKLPSIHGDTGGSIFTNGQGFDKFYPWKSKAEHPNKLMLLIHDVGVPKEIISDGAKELTDGKTGEICNEYRIKQKVTVPYSWWQNKAEAAVGNLKKGVRRTLRRTNAHRRTWSYCGKWICDTRCLTASDISELNGQTPFAHVIGSTPDISALAQFDYYEIVHTRMPAAKFPYEHKVLGRWLGVADSCTDALAYWILLESGKLVIRKDVWALSSDEMGTDSIQVRIKKLDDGIVKTLGPLNPPEKESGKRVTFNNTEEPEAPPDLFEGDEPIPMEVDDPDSLDQELPDADDYTPEEYDEYISANVVLPNRGEHARAVVTARRKDQHGRPIGLRHNNPMLDTREYEVTFPDGHVEEYSTNLIAENLYSQVDAAGHSFSIFKDIIGHRSDERALKRDDPTVLDGSRKRTTIGWDIEIECDDGSSIWIPLKDVKASNPVELAEYAVSAKLTDEPAFAWWVRPTLRRRDRLIKKVKTRYWKRTHKFGIEMPKSVKQAIAIDLANGNTLWRDAIDKEMRNVSVAFKFLDDNKVPPGYKHIDCHMVYDIKADLTRKARLVAGGHQTEEPTVSCYSSVVSRDSVRIAFTIAALNDLDVLAGDIQNAYLNAETKERCYTTAGLEFGPDNEGRPVLIVRALYGLKSSGQQFRFHLANNLRAAGFASSLADPDVWMRKNVKPCGFLYWEYVLCYVDDVLCISHDPQAIMDYLSGVYTLKPGSVGEPTDYLGCTIKKHLLPGSSKPKYAMSSDLYVKRAVEEVERELAHTEQKLRTKVTAPVSPTYRPEIDFTPELDARRANYFQGLIGVLRWIIEIGRIDIIVPVTLLSRHLVAPREGHLDQVFHIFAYLKSHDRSMLVFDDTTPHYEESRFQQADWSEYYPDAADEVPSNMPESRGNPVTTTCYVDADHAGCRETRRSHTGILIFVQQAPIIWYSKRQNTVETSTFGSEFVAMKTAIDQVEALRYKLRMFGIPLDGVTNVFCDNESVFRNASVPESTLKKRHNAIAYHRTREAIAAGIVRLAWEDGKTNVADLLTKILAGPRLKELVQMVLY